MLRVESFRERLRSVSSTSLVSVALFLTLSLALSAQTASLEVAAEIEAGSVVSVTWAGPEGPGDFLAISTPNAPAGEFLSYARASSGNPAEFRSPAIGEYELRYIHAADLSILARVALKIIPPSSAMTMSAPSTIVAGAAITISVSDPGKPSDYVTIVEIGSPDNAFGAYVRLQGQASVTLNAPEVAGSYEIRQIRAAGQIVLNRLPLVIEPQADERQEAVESGAPDQPAMENADPKPVATARMVQPAPAPSPAVQVRLMALVAVDPSSEFRVALSVPVSVEARLIIVPEGKEASSRETSVGAERILRVTAPDVSGMYEIRLVAAKSGAIITSRPLEVR